MEKKAVKDENIKLVTSDASVPLVFGGQPPKNLIEFRATITTALDAWLAKTESKRTRVAYRNDVEQFLQFLGIDPSHIEYMTQVLPVDVTDWRDSLLRSGGRQNTDGSKKAAANATVARKMTAIRSFFSFLQSYGYRGANPAHPHFVSTPKVPDEGQTPAIPQKQMVQLLAAPSSDTACGIRDQAILSVFAYMAVRVEEIHLMKVGDIVQDGEHTTIRIKGKGNSLRKGGIPPIAATAVNNWIATADIVDDRSGPLFRPSMSARGSGSDGFKPKRMTVRAIQKLVRKYCSLVGIDKAVSVHSLRVTAATEADRAGVPLNQIQQWLGHKDPRTTLKYIRSGQNLDKSPAYTIRYG